MLETDVLIHEAESIKEALKKLDKTGRRVLLVVEDGNRLLGTITDGDIRRYILSGNTLENNISGIYNRNPIYIRKSDFSVDLAKKILLNKTKELLPILDENSRVVDFITWDQAFSEDEIVAAIGKINIPVVIVAGGKGERLEPFTRIFPKALIPIGDKPIIEIIIEEFRKQGVDKFYITLNYKTEMIKSYFSNKGKDYEITLVKENASSGTVGSLKLLEKEIDGICVVSNCDVIVRANFEEVIYLHREQGASLTVLSSIQHHKIPYGVINFKEGGEIVNINEKPEYTFAVNAGVYVLNKECLGFIPRDVPFDMTDLIKTLIKNNKKIITYPVNESDYIDVGQWEEYKKAIEKLRVLM